jgi:hypothetical protein
MPGFSLRSAFLHKTVLLCLLLAPFAVARTAATPLRMTVFTSCRKVVHVARALSKGLKPLLLYSLALPNTRQRPILNSPDIAVC